MYYFTGKDWLYIKIYCSPYISYFLMKDYIFPFIDNLENGSLNISYFFLRYRDNSDIFLSYLTISEYFNSFKFTETEKLNSIDLFKLNRLKYFKFNKENKLLIDMKSREYIKYIYDWEMSNEIYIEDVKNIFY